MNDLIDNGEYSTKEAYPPFDINNVEHIRKAFAALDEKEKFASLRDAMTLSSLLNAIAVDCKGEGCNDEETREVMAAFLEPMKETLINQLEKVKQKQKHDKDHSLFDDDELC